MIFFDKLGKRLWLVFSLLPGTSFILPKLSLGAINVVSSRFKTSWSVNVSISEWICDELRIKEDCVSPSKMRLTSSTKFCSLSETITVSSLSYLLFQTVNYTGMDLFWIDSSISFVFISIILSSNY